MSSSLFLRYVNAEKLSVAGKLSDARAGAHCERSEAEVGTERA